ncbi:helix-turn-helix domain-containing protein [Microvirga sp. STR05]|uniref:Helix-turn-helix domain-containing protein n=2 Tax=Hymenobacter duratus TaxID=2771356 RepID=A0ABR8JHW6_9BACT|nr:helix-turn-helix domain-containing protein [Hymenobacter duratus]MBR7951367.1 helix-turn-helix domain-containing protein [Microvirga sp. STR05]
MLQNPSYQRIEETLYYLTKIQPQELAPLLAARYTRYSYTVARQQLQELANTLSILSVSVTGFIMDSEWQRREAEATEQLRLHTNPQTGQNLLSVAQVATRLSLTKQKVYKMIQTGQLPAIDVNAQRGRKTLLRIRESDLPQ